MYKSFSKSKNCDYKGIFVMTNVKFKTVALCLNKICYFLKFKIVLNNNDKNSHQVNQLNNIND